MAENTKQQDLLQIMADARALRKGIDEKHASFTAGKGEAVTAEEVAAYEGVLETGRNLRKQIELEKQAAELEDFLSKPIGGPRHGKGIVREKSWGDIVVASHQFKSAREAGRHEMDRVNVKAIHGDTDAAGAAFVIPERGETLRLPVRPVSILDLVNVLPTGSDSVEYVEMLTRVNAAAPVAAWDTAGGDFGAKPDSDLTFVLRTAPVKVIAHYIPAGRTILQDAPQLRGLIDTELTEMLREELEDQILNGNGTGANFTGILQASGIQVRTQGNTAQRAGETTDTAADTIRRSITDVRLELHEPNGIVLNPGNGESIELDKTADGAYVNIYDSATGTMWRLPVSETPAIASGTGLVGNFFMGCTLWDRQVTEIRVGEPNDYFLRNAVAILAELRAAFAVKRATAFSKITFS